MKDSMNLMDFFIENILLLRQIQDGVLVMNEVDFNPKWTMKQTVDLFQQLARAKKIKLSFTIPDFVGRMPKYVKGDEKRFR